MFTYKNKNSKNFGLRVLNEVTFTSPVRDVSLIQVPGRDGDLVRDNGRFNSVIKRMPCRLEVSDDGIEQAISRVNNWLIDDGRFHEFEWEGDPEFLYRARIHGDVSTARFLSRFGKTMIDFSFHPVKYLKSSLGFRQVSSGDNVRNEFNIDAKPRLRVLGNGDVTIHINGRPLVLRGISGGCLIDSESMSITDLEGQYPWFERMFSPFPVLTSGDNLITFGSNVSVFIEPRLGALV